MDFRILGPVEAVGEDGSVPLGGTRKSLLALLLLHANEAMSTERLVEELWGASPPATALRMVRNAVSRLRRLLDADRLTTRAGAYELHVEPDELDALRFERLARTGREALAAGDAAVAAEALGEALGLWRGPALAEFVYAPFAHAAVARLEELRLDALEDRIDAELELGRHGDLLGELEALVLEQPLRERLRAQLMLALYRSGRQAEALGLFQQTRRLLVDELGIEPGPALRRLEQAILRHDPALEPPARRTNGPVAAPAVPAPAHETRRTVTLVVVDMAGAGEDDPEARRATLARGTESAEAVLARHVGSVRRTETGKLLAVFGVPEVREDDALRAVRAAAELREQLGPAARISVASGDVIAGAGPVEGAVVARALRLVEATPAGEVHVAPEAARLVRGAATLELLDGGDARLVELAEDAPAIARRFATPLVGRETELRLLSDAFARAVESETAELFTLLGAPGVGKSKLAIEFAASLGDQATILTGRALSYGEGITFWPLREIALSAFGPDVEAGIARLLAADSEGATVAARVASAIGAGEAVASREETLRAARRVFEALSLARPLVLLVEDMHWAEPTFLDLVEHVAELGRGPILVLCLARPELLERRPLWAGGRARFRSILLEPLSESESEELIDALLTGPLPPEARARIAATAEGNPLFLEQVLALLEDEGVGGEAIVPPTIHALLASRLERLDSAERSVLERASIAGRSFSPAAVVELSPEEERPTVESRLEALVRRDLIRPEPSATGEEAFRFAHLLIREAAYESVPKRARAELHERLADRIERTAAEPIDELVAYHLEQAHRFRRELGADDEATRELGERAADRLATAGRRAHARGDAPATASLLGRAAALLEPGDARRPGLLADLAEALRERGDVARANIVLDELDATTGGDAVLSSMALVVRRRLELVTIGVDNERLVVETQTAVDVFERAGDERLLGKAWELLASAAWLRCRAGEAEEALRSALVHALKAGDVRTEAQCVYLSIGAAVFGPLPAAEGIRRCEAILGRRDTLPRVAAAGLRALAALTAMEGRFDEARMRIAEARHALEDLGLALAAAQAAETAGVIELLAGDAEAAEHELRDGYDRLEHMAATMRANLAALLAQALSAQGEHEEALRYGRVAAQASSHDDLSAQVHWRVAQARALAGLDRRDEATPRARKAGELAAQTDFINVQADALVVQAAAIPAEAVCALTEAAALYEQKGNVVSAASARELLKAASEASCKATR